MEKLVPLILENETWLVRRILQLAKLHDFTKYTSTLEEAWRLSIQGLSESLLSAVRSFDGPPDFGPDDTFTGDPLTDFGVVEAGRHLERGASLSMFLGLLKYYKQAYLELLFEEAPPELNREAARYFLERSFDRIEIAVCKTWSACEVSPMIDSLRNTARAMTNEKNAYLTVFESLSDAVIMVGDDGVITDMNLKALSFTHENPTPGVVYHTLVKGADEDVAARESKPLVGRQGAFLEAILPWLSPIFLNAKGGATLADATVVEAPSKEGPRYFEVKHSTLLDVSGKFAGHIFTLRDVTERKSMEDKLAALARRSIELERLRHWESLGMLSTGIAHDFNNLLAVVASRGRFAKKYLSKDLGLAADAVDPILDAVDKGVELTRAMHAYSGSGVHGAQLHDLNELVDQWARSKPVLLPRNVEFLILNDAKLPKASVNREQIFIILSNLLSNAQEALGDKGGSIVIQTGTAKRETAAGYSPVFSHDSSVESYVYLEVSDTGIGMEESVLPKIFDPFYSTKFVGRGLGLATVRGAVAAHRGAVRIRSAPGKGCAVQILFPLHSNERLDDAPPLSPSV